MMMVNGLELVVPIEPFCTGVAVIDSVLLPALLSLVTLFKMIATAALLLTAIGDLKVRVSPLCETIMVMGVPLTVPPVIVATLLVPGKTMVMLEEVVRSQPSR